MLERLIKFYRRYHTGSVESSSVVWKTINKEYHQDLHSALFKGDTKELRSVLDSAAGSGLLHGLEQHAIGWDSGQAMDLLHRLARSTGVLAVHNPESESPTSNWLCPDVDILRRKIERRTGISLSLPNHVGFELHDGETKITHRFFHYCAVAHASRNYLGRCPKNTLEIGAGLGNLGVILFQWGAESYTIIDLPIVAVLSAYCLSINCGSDKVWLCGEPENDHCFSRIYPSTNFQGALGTDYDLVVNMDSFPEIPNDAQDQYLSLISSKLLKDGVFISVNHESDALNQGRVLVAASRNPNLRLVSRHPFMIRDGYIEEYYERA